MTGFLLKVGHLRDRQSDSLQVFTRDVLVTNVIIDHDPSEFGVRISKTEQKAVYQYLLYIPEII